MQATKKKAAAHAFCKRCKAPFSPRPHGKTTKKFCSKTCKDRYRSKNYYWDNKGTPAYMAHRRLYDQQRWHDPARKETLRKACLKRYKKWIAEGRCGTCGIKLGDPRYKTCAECSHGYQRQLQHIRRPRRST